MTRSSPPPPTNAHGGRDRLGAPTYERARFRTEGLHVVRREEREILKERPRSEILRTPQIPLSPPFICSTRARLSGLVCSKPPLDGCLIWGSDALTAAILGLTSGPHHVTRTGIGSHSDLRPRRRHRISMGMGDGWTRSHLSVFRSASKSQGRPQVYDTRT